MAEHVDRCAHAMHHAVVDTLENMVFMEVAQSTASPAATEPKGMTVSLLIHDPLQGELRLRMPKELVALITASVYSLEVHELTDQMLSDNLAELINIIAGRFMGELLTDGRPFRLGLPELDPDEIDRNSPFREWSYTINDLGFAITAMGQALWAD
jgi:CheY-specific phosphatase CheX